MVLGIPQACGVHHMQGHAIDVNMFAQYIAGGAGYVRDDGRLATGQGIQ